MVWPAIIAAGAALAGGALSGDANRKARHEEQDLQREFAQKGLQWKAADAKAAGLHPLAALGATGASYTPVMVGDSYGPALAQAGQNVSSAMERTQTQPERDEAGMQRLLMQIEARETARENAARQYNMDQAEAERRAQEHQRRMDILELQHRQVLDQIMARNQSQEPKNPPFASSTDLYGPYGTTDMARGRGVPSVSPDPRLNPKPNEYTVQDRYEPHRTAGVKPAFDTVRTSPTTTMDVPAFQTDAEIPQTLRELRAYLDKWIWEWQGSKLYRQAPNYRSGARPLGPRMAPN